MFLFLMVLFSIIFLVSLDLADKFKDYKNEIMYLEEELTDLKIENYNLDKENFELKEKLKDNFLEN